MSEGEEVRAKPAASAAVFRGGAVLIVQRGAGALKGMWSLPGGHIEAGETARAAALREVNEETGVTAEAAGLVDVHDALIRNTAGVLVAHYVICVFAARWTAGEPVAASDAAAARFVPLGELGGYRLTGGAHALIERAAAMVGAPG